MHDRPDAPDAPTGAIDVIDDEPIVEDDDVAAGALDDEDVDPGAGGPPTAPDGPPFDRWYRSFVAKPGMEIAGVAVDVVIVVAAVVFVLVSLHPDLLISNTTPAGGDMGAHVWGPAYLRDHLLPSFRLSGWTPDWYAGFPAYVFYMVVPALAIVALDAGFSGWAALVPAAIAVALLGVAGTHGNRRVRRAAFVAALLIGIIGIGLPYGVAFKLIAVSGLLALPICCYVAGRLADLPFPGPVLLSIASVVFLFNREPVANNAGTGNIIGGNVASTLAGEFSFSISLALCVLYIGFLLRGLKTGQYRRTAAVLLALTALCHIIPGIYAVVATVAALAVSMPLGKERLKWFLPVGPVAGLLAAFWLGPFYLDKAYLNDMGWEKLPGPCASGATTCATLRDYLWPNGLMWVIALALVGAVVSALLKIRLGVLLSLCAVVTSVLFVVTPQSRLWNARLLPFLYLCFALLAGIAISELARAISALVVDRPEQRVSAVTLAAPIGGALAIYLLVAIPLGVFPLAHDTTDGGVAWGPIHFSSSQKLVVRSWARWNFSGYEGDPQKNYVEYHDMVAMAQRIAADPDLGCGRVMWEYDNDRLNSYGTPMAPMLLPFWTDGCMGSMEGLYFEASSTTPYHFLNQRALSTNCSCAQRYLPYGPSFDIGLGIAQLRHMGVRYYFAFTPGAVAAADADPDLTPVDSTAVWHAYLVHDSDLVSPLPYKPVVLTGLEPGMSWVGPASKWWEQADELDTPLAADGPSDWPREAVCDTRTKPGPRSGSGHDNAEWTYLDVCDSVLPQVALPANTVSNISTGTDHISFDVSTPGVPVVVKASYFPNWKVANADGPYRLTPNLMVVVPHGTHVELHYGWTTVDLASYGLTFVGFLALIGLGFLRRPVPGKLWLDGTDSLGAVNQSRRSVADFLDDLADEVRPDDDPGPDWRPPPPDPPGRGPDDRGDLPPHPGAPAADEPFGELDDLDAFDDGRWTDRPLR